MFVDDREVDGCSAELVGTLQLIDTYRLDKLAQSLDVTCLGRVQIVLASHATLNTTTTNNTGKVNDTKHKNNQQYWLSKQHKK